MSGHNNSYDKRDYLHYKNYVGRVEFSEKDEVFHGQVAGIKALITFEGDSVKAITQDFRQAVDEYLGFCTENGQEPERPFKGLFNIRVGAELHRQTALTASIRDVPLNTLVEEAIRQAVSQ